MDWLQDFHFLRPYWLIALILPLIFGWRALKNDAVQSSWANVCDEHLLKFLLIRGHNEQRRLPYILLSFIVFLTVLALAGPTWIKKQSPALSVDNPVMIVLNMSSDMWVKDVSPNRMVRAEYTATDLLKNFKSTENGLLVYSSEPFVISPLTEDFALIENLLSQLDNDVMPENGDRLDRAIDLAVERLQKSGYGKGNIIILTADVGERFDAALESAEKAGDLGFDINVIKFTDEKNEKLAMIADKGRGIYLDYKQNLQPLINKINDIYADELKQSDNMQTIWEDMGYYLFWLPALLLLYFFRKGVLIAGLILIFGIQTVQAGMFLNNNQEAMRAFEKQNYSEAAAKFDIAQWKGAAQYKDGNFEKAYESFALADDATALYNQGNALAKSGKIAEAIKKYEQALKKKADFEDARFNLEYLKKMLQQQQQNKDNQKQQQNQKDSEQNQKQDKQEQNQQQNQDNQKDNQDKNMQNQDNKEQNSSSSENNQPQEGEEKEQQKQNSQQQNGQDKQNPDGKGQDSTEDNKDVKEQQNQSKADNKEDERADNDAQVNKQSMYGNEDEKSEQTAEALSTQAGAKSNEEKERIRAKLQKFRDVPDDKGGLIRALIRKEYKLNRYNNK